MGPPRKPVRPAQNESCLHTALPSHAPTLTPSSSDPALSIRDGNEPCWVTQTHGAQKMSRVWPLPSFAGFLSVWRWLSNRINDGMHREQHQWAQRNSGQTQKTTKACGNDLRMSLGNLTIIVLFCMYWVWKADNCSRVPVEIRRSFVLVSKETKSFSTLSKKRGKTIFLPGNVSSCETPLKQWSFISDEFGPLFSRD